MGVIYLDNQRSIDNDGHWEDIVPDKPEDIVSLEIGDDFVGTFILRRENKESKYKSENKKTWIYDLKRENDKSAIMYSTTNLDLSMRKLEPNARIRILRLDDKPMQPPKQAMQVYKVQQWVSGGN